MLSFIKAELSQEYRKTWNISQSQNDFVYLAKDYVKISNQLYREGSFDILKQTKYFTLLKQVESIYPDNITNDQNKKKYLANHQCILDNNGIEKCTFSEFDNVYLLKDSCIYTKDNYYYNIETGLLYCRAYSFVDTNEEIYLQITNKEKRIMIINKITGLAKIIE